MVPEGWKKIHLVDILEDGIKNGFSPNAVDYDTGFWVLGLSALGDNGFNTDEIKHVEATNRVKSKILKCDDFLISRSNTPDKVGRSARYRGNIENCSYPDLMMRFRVDIEKVDMGFIEQKLRSSVIRNYYRSCAAGSSGTMVKINKSTVEKTPIQLPSIPEQKKIAKILSTWDKAIETVERLIANSKQQKKALMQQLLTGKKRFPGFGKPAFGGEIPEGWFRKSLYGCLIQSHLRNKKKKLSHYDLRSVNKTQGMILMKDQVKGATVDRCKIVKQDWFAYNPMRLNVGSICRWDSNEECLVSPDYVVFYCDNRVLQSDYFDQIRKSFLWNDFMVRAGRGSVRVRIYLKDLAPLKIKIPPLSEQRKIAKVLSGADQAIETLVKKLTHLKQEKKALMQQLLTGKRRVKVDEHAVAETAN